MRNFLRRGLPGFHRLTLEAEFIMKGEEIEYENHLVPWELVCKTKKKQGLGIATIILRNEVL